MEASWMNLDIEKSIYDYEFTRLAVQELNKVIVSEDFEKMDAKTIFHYLSGKMRIVKFNDYLKRYIYEKSGIEKPFETIPEDLYREIIVSSFRENRVPFSSKKPDDARIVRKWLKRESVKRDTIFLLGFGLRMSDKDVSEFLTKVIQEDDFDLFNIDEAIFWYCFRHDLGYANAMTFLNYARAKQEQSKDSVSLQDKSGKESSWEVMVTNPKMYILTDQQLLNWIDHLKENRIEENRYEIRFQTFCNLYERVRRIIARIYTDYSEETGHYREWKTEDITPGDVEKSLCSGIPVNSMGNLQKMSMSVLAEQFQNKRMDRQRITKILTRKYNIGRFDLITLLFYIYAEEIEPDWPVERYLQYIDEVNDILTRCSMMGIYPVNPYESFILMCLVTEGPLDVYSEVLEQSFE